MSKPRTSKTEPDPTRQVYETRAVEWRDCRQRTRTAEVDHLVQRVAGSEAPIADLGCGPGWYAAQIAAAGMATVGIDNARAMLDLAATAAPTAQLVQADLRHLPFQTASLGGALASNSYVHLQRSAIPLALHDLHRCLRAGAPVYLHLFPGDQEYQMFPHDDFPGRHFSAWPLPLLDAVLVGAGFTIDSLAEHPPTPTVSGSDGLHAHVHRAHTLADTVGPGMRLLVVGLNPSVYSADVSVGFGRPGNRFWPAAHEAGLVTKTHDPRHALTHDHIGMTDLVKRATRKADELTTADYRAGFDRLELLAGWLQPQALCFVGLAGWRAAVDRKAVAGKQGRSIGGRPVYVMPSTSGLNAHSSLADLTDHLRHAAALG